MQTFAQTLTRQKNTNNHSPMETPSSAKIAIADDIPATGAGAVPGIRRLWKSARMLHEREKSRLRYEIAQIPGLMTLLMKPRNGLGWTKAERVELWEQLCRLSRLSLYLAMALLPFTTLTLPLVAWWLDRRRRQRE